MYLENVVVDATDPQALGRFWEAVLGTERLTDEHEGFETRLAVPQGPVLDLCFQRVPEPADGQQRLRLDLDGGMAVLLARGAAHVDAEPGQAPGTLLADPEGNLVKVTDGSEDAALAALSLPVVDPAREAEFWAWLTGWSPVPDDTATQLVRLRHGSGRGPLLELRAQEEPKGPGKNRMHLDVRLEPGEDPDAIAREVAARGGRELRHPEWGELPWRFFIDPSGNDFCLLSAH